MWVRREVRLQADGNWKHSIDGPVTTTGNGWFQKSITGTPVAVLMATLPTGLTANDQDLGGGASSMPAMPEGTRVFG
ncbi:hypothetical protein [Paenarthrobacter sp. A20]|uniref:hypothetical protein n=1 Tax=Paenarthrobacter sp. A20 TaxID=2817891 RepID=UPI00209C8655|nr:hypothetical protein [Paenarthrobacter sp. A20]MCP1412170.1 hypothetical protein [Paenarthrobacter sp. A20]